MNATDRTRRRNWLLSVLLFVVGALTHASASQSVTLEWDADSDPDIAGYLVLYGTRSGVYDKSVNVGLTTSASLSDLRNPNTYFAVVVAYDYRGVESLPSEEIAFSPRGSRDALTIEGVYTGSVVEGYGGNNALVRFKIIGPGAFTGRVFLGNRVGPFKGSFGLNGTATVQFKIGPERRTLSLELDPESGRFTAVISGRSGDIRVVLARGVSPSDTLPDKYLMSLGPVRSVRSINVSSPTIPAGGAFARVTMTDVGRVRVVGKLGDGETFSTVSELDGRGGFDICAIPPKLPRGILAGRVQLQEAAAGGSGIIWRFKPPQARGGTAWGSTDWFRWSCPRWWTKPKRQEESGSQVSRSRATHQVERRDMFRRAVVDLRNGPPFLEAKAHGVN